MYVQSTEKQAHTKNPMNGTIGREDTSTYNNSTNNIRDGSSVLVNVGGGGLVRRGDDTYV